VKRKTRTAILAIQSEKPKNEPGNQEECEQPEKRFRFDGNGEAEPPIDERAPARAALQRQVISKRAETEADSYSAPS
jgi:hypothetical protein